MRRNVKLSLFAAAVFGTGLSLAVLGSVLSSGMDMKPVALSDNDREVIRRTVETAGSGSESEAQALIEHGLMTEGDYILRAFTSASYLWGQPDDDTFASDLSYALSGDRESGIRGDILSQLSGSSRMYALSSSLSDMGEGYVTSTFVPDTRGDSVEDFVLRRSIQGPDGYALGIRKVEGSFNVTGEQVRSDFFVDGVLHQGTINMSSEGSSNGTRDFVMAWDTAGTSAGEHDVSILLRSSDGRGSVVDGGHITVPSCMTLVNDGVQQGSIDMLSSNSWYMLDASDRNAYINFVNMSDDIKVSLYDACGDLIGTNDLPQSDYEVLRGLKQDTEAIANETGVNGVSNVFYVRVERGAQATTSGETVHYTMIQSRNVARYCGEYYAVSDELPPVPTQIPVIGTEGEETEITLIDLNNNRSTASSEDVSFLPLEAELSDMGITENGETGSYFPVFAPSLVNYGLWLDSDGRSLTVAPTAQQGYAADVKIFVADNSGERQIEYGGTVPLNDGQTEIRISVTSFDGVTKSYNLYILNGDDNGTFSEDTLSRFPASYRSGLWMLHSVHPGYIFRPYDTGLDFEEVLDNEDNVDRSLANINSTPGWVVPESPVYDGGGWMTARNNVVRYFLDPRNFLDQRRVFQFELLSFDETCHTIEGVRALISGSFMDTDEYDYATAIYNAGMTSGVSPYFLASKIIQEMGYSGQSLLCHGTLPGYEGYYNFYNIGSTPDPDIENGALINGARYAMWGRDPDGQTITPEEAELLLPWDNIDDALTGGALWIASRYTAAGQDTLYFQKFDVIDNDDGLYEHQYAQNISMAYEESLRYFSGYSSIDMLDQSFVFVIPVYSSMPSDFGIMPSK
ncbi:MAG: cadherin-like beta sandwich domain-containing protein [Clostridiales bacterium]|nr:cadherin-like beta sandwich domain-containing protein [Clostridiales bacterium]